MPEGSIRPLAAHDDAEWRRLWTGYLDHNETTVPEEVYAACAAGTNGTPSVYCPTQDVSAAGRHLYDCIGKQTRFTHFDR